MNNDPIMERIKYVYFVSPLNGQQLGLRMGYPASSARKSVQQFLKTNDPRISMIRKFCLAMNISLAELLEETK